MENDFLDKVWHMQDENMRISNAETIINRAKRQRKHQIFGTIIMSITVAVLIGYTIYTLPNSWNDFSSGLILMISSLLFRIILEVVTIHRKESKLISMDTKSYRSYLKKFYRWRLLINYLVTPICVVLYIYGFYLLLPYFKNEFSEGFYGYILISGIISLVIIIAIIVYNIMKERHFLEKLKKK